MPRHRTGRWRSGTTRWWIAAGLAVIALVGWLVWNALAPEPAAEAEGVITTLVGKSGPGLRLPDADGRVHTVPERGRPTVLIFHMGLF